MISRQKSPGGRSDEAAGNEGREAASAPDHLIAGSAKKMPRGRGRYAVFEKEAQRMATLKRRQAMELQQMLAFELRSLAREARTTIEHFSI